MERRENTWTRWGLVVLLIIAAGLRFYKLDWDEGQHAHPDERWIAMVAPAIAWPQDGSNVFDPRRSTLNPLWTPDGNGGGQVRNFAYGHLPLYLHAWVGNTLSAWGKAMTRWGPGYQEMAYALQSLGEYGGISLVGRALSALLDLGTICLVYLLGKRIYDRNVGLLGAALVTFAVMHIQLSHFATFDVITTFFITLSVYGSVCVSQARENHLWTTLWAGAAAGLAIASKFSAAPLLFVLVLAQVIRAVRRADGDGAPVVVQVLRRASPDVVTSLLVAGVAFFVASPFALLDLKLYLKQIVEQGTMVRGTADWPFTRQYRNTMPFVYQIVQQVRWGLGWPLGIVAFAGFGWTLWRQFRRVCAEELVMLGWAVPYFLLTGSFMVKFMRYMLPLLPLFILMGASMMMRIGGWASRRMDGATGGGARRAWYSVLRYLPHLVLVFSALWALAFMWVYAQEHPWIQASRWIYANIADGSVLAVEHWDDHLPLSLPIDYANPGAHGYRHVELPMYEPDTFAKYDLVRALLREADYVIFSSNRLYRTIPRLPERYPVSAEFYRLFFDERLGFVREVEFSAYPALLGLRFVDDDADESFTVYDHPRPIVFRKERDLTDLEWDQLFAVALSTPPRWEAAEKREFALFERPAPTEGNVERTLLLDAPVGDLPVVADFGWNRWASASTVGATLLWWLVVALLGWLVFPIVFVIFSGLRDRGYLLSRAIGLLVVGYLVWLPAALHWLKNGLPLTLGAIVVTALFSALLMRRYGAPIGAFLRAKWRVVLLGELVFGLAFLLFVGIRVLNPDLWQPWNGGEKGMDIAYLNACLRSAYLPPYDPYYSDGYLNYYYYGQFLVSIVTRLTGLTTTVAFNLAVPLYFALTVSNVFAIGYTLAGRVFGGAGSATASERTWRFGVGHGLLSVLCVTVLGNLASATQLIVKLGRIGQPGTAFESRIPGVQAAARAASGLWQVVLRRAQLPSFNYWDPSRVVGSTINEFPYWSFLFADLHPHMINIPFTALAVAFALNWLLRKREPIDIALPADCGRPLPGGEWALFKTSFCYLWQRLDWGELLNWPLWALALGVLASINTWDFPAYAGLSGLVLLFVWVRTRGRQGVVPALAAGVGLAAVGVWLYAPFFRYYTVLHAGLGWSLGRISTDLGEFLVMWGFLLFGAISLLLVVWGARRRSRWAVLRLIRLAARHLGRLHRLERVYGLLVRENRLGYWLSFWGLGALALLVFFAFKGYWLLFVMTPLLLLAAAMMVDAGMTGERRFVLALVFTAFLLLVGIELFYLKDFLAGDTSGWWRMNTLFKFYLQVWMMLGIAVGASLPGVWRAVERWRAGWRWGWTTVFALLLAAAALYPLLGTPARVLDRFPGARPPIGTLDGMAFMTVGAYNWPDDRNRIELRGDYEAICWLRDHVTGTPVLAEAPIGYYREFGVRVASYTGLPTLLGMHESEQRYDWQVGRRSAQGRELFMSTDLERTVALIDELGVEYIYIGPLEKTQYPHSVSKFEQLAFTGHLSVAYQNDLVTIYQVVE